MIGYNFYTRPLGQMYIHEFTNLAVISFKFNPDLKVDSWHCREYFFGGLILQAFSLYSRSNYNKLLLRGCHKFITT